jgi:hypothetical protein
VQNVANDRNVNWVQLSTNLKADISVNNPYEEGRNHRTYSGGDWNEYTRGQQGRERYQQAIGVTPREGPSTDLYGLFDLGNGAPWSAASRWFVIAIALAFIVPAIFLKGVAYALTLVVIVCASAIVSAGVAISAGLMFMAIGAISARDRVPSFGMAWRAAFVGTFMYLAITGSIGASAQIWVGVEGSAGPFSELPIFVVKLVAAIESAWVHSANFLKDTSSATSVRQLSRAHLQGVTIFMQVSAGVLLHAPGLIAFTVSITKHFTGWLHGWRGFLAALPIAIGTVLLCLPATLWVTTRLFDLYF